MYCTYFGGDAVTCIGGSVCVGATASTQPLVAAVGPSGAVVIAGETTAADLPVSPGVIGAGCACTNLTPNGFLAAFSAGNLSKLAWSTYVNLGNGLPPVLEPTNRFVGAVAIDASGDVVIGGKAEVGLATTPGVLQPALTSGAEGGGFLAKVSGSGTNLAWMTWLGGGSPPLEPVSFGYVASLALDPQGNIVVTGSSQTSQYPPSPGSPVLGPSYVARVTGDGTSLTELFAGPQSSAGAAVALTATGNFASLGQSGALWIETAAGGPSLLAIANAADGPVSGLVAPAEIFSLYGIGIGPSTAVPGRVTAGVYSSSLAGYQLLFGGVAAPLLYVGPTQINAVVPQSVSLSDSTQVQLVTPSGTVNGPTLAVRRAVPCIFQYGLANPIQDGTTSLAAALNQDGSINSVQNPAKAGEIVTIFASGGGGFGDPVPDGAIVVYAGPAIQNALLPVSVLSDVPAFGLQTSLDVLYAGSAPEEVYGVMQINFRLPATFPKTSSLTHRVALQVGGTIGGSASVAIGQ